ncbi:MAG: ComF family protein [Xanthomonadales bacterium]|nr:ComF family protein [Xanthomonadales bacterium]
MKYEKHTPDCQSEKTRRKGTPGRRWWQASLDFLLPPRCILCGQCCTAICICEPCKLELPWIDFNCRQCGLPLGSATDDICGACIQNPPPFTRTVCPLRYEFPADRMVQLFKFQRQHASGRILAHLLSEHAANCEDDDYPEVLIPVPLHNWRMVRRGFNQAYELTSYISKVLDIPLLTNSLRRRRNTKAQSGLSRLERRRNVRGAFYWRGSEPPGRHVALIDDVMTTGTTVYECARVLKKAGARRVDVWVAARAIPSGR